MINRGIMFYKVLADMVVIVHFLWILFLIFGALLAIKNRIAKIVHICGLLYALIIHLFQIYCPLTHLEIWLRSRHNPSLSYAGSFVIHYLERFVYIELSRYVLLALTIMLCAFNLWIYLTKNR